MAQWFLTHGHRVALWDNAALRATEAALDDPSRVLAIHCDVSQPAQVTDATEQTEGYLGRIDALVTNAPQRSEAPARQAAGKTRLRRSDS